MERKIKWVEARRREKNESEKTVDTLRGGTKMTLRNYVLNKINEIVI